MERNGLFGQSECPNWQYAKWDALGFEAEFARRVVFKCGLCANVALRLTDVVAARSRHPLSVADPPQELRS